MELGPRTGDVIDLADDAIHGAVGDHDDASCVQGHGEVGQQLKDKQTDKTEKRMRKTCQKHLGMFIDVRKSLIKLGKFGFVI